MTCREYKARFDALLSGEAMPLSPDVAIDLAAISKTWTALVRSGAARIEVGPSGAWLVKE